MTSWYLEVTTEKPLDWVGLVWVLLPPRLQRHRVKASLALHSTQHSLDHLAPQLPLARVELGLEPWSQLLCCLPGVEAPILGPGQWRGRAWAS